MLSAVEAGAGIRLTNGYDRKRNLLVPMGSVPLPIEIARSFIDLIYGQLEVSRNNSVMKTLPSAFVALMILISLDQLCFDGRYVNPVIGTLRYFLGTFGLQF